MTSPAVIELQHRFGVSPEKLLALFNPEMQTRYCRDVQRAHFGNAPSLSVVKAAYGENVAVSWLILQLNDLALFAGCRDKLSARQVKETAEIMLRKYNFFKLTEFMLFFQRFKECHYERFYGSVDPMVILQSIRIFESERHQAIVRKEEVDRKAQARTEDLRFEQMRRRYAERVPDAFTENAPIDFLQYNLMRYDELEDAQFADVLNRICKGHLKLPKDSLDLLNFARSLQ